MSAKPIILYFDEYDMQKLKNVATDMGIFVNDYQANDNWFVDLIERLSEKIRLTSEFVLNLDNERLILSNKIEEMEAEIKKIKKTNELFVIE